MKVSAYIHIIMRICAVFLHVIWVRLESARGFSGGGIFTKGILDAAGGGIMEEVDMCLVGAEGVMENGGIVNKVSG